MSGIISLIQDLPQILALLEKLGSVVAAFKQWSEQHQLENWIKNLESGIDKLKAAQTSQEKLNAASSLLDVINGIK